MATSDVLAELACKLTTAPSYLLSSSLLNNKHEQHTDKNNTAFHLEEPSESKVLVGTTQVCKSLTCDIRDFRLAKMENTLLKLHVSSSLTVNHLLAQWSVTCVKSSPASHLGMKQLSHLEPNYISQKMSQLCTPSLSLTLASREKLTGTCGTLVFPAVPVEVKNNAGRPKSAKENAAAGKALETKEMSAVGKQKLKPVKKVNFSVLKQVDSVEPASSFELPSYQLTHEDVDSQKIELFVPPEKEELAEQQLMQHVVDVQSIKVR